MSLSFHLSATALDPEEFAHRLLDVRAGALASFEGRVRGRNEGREVVLLEYEAFTELAEKEGSRILVEARKKYAIVAAAGVHRTGRLQIGELAVWVGVTAEHRAAAFDACRYIVDEMKIRVPIWKKEHYPTGASLWINSGETDARGPDSGRKM